MPRVRRPDQGTPIARTRNACIRCKEKRYKCSTERPCSHCVANDTECVVAKPMARKKSVSSVQGLSSGSFKLTSARSRDPSSGLQPSHGTPKYEFDLDDRISVGHSTQLDAPGPSSLPWVTDHRIANLPSQLDVVGSHQELNQKVLSDKGKLRDHPKLMFRPSSPGHSSLLSAHPAHMELWYHYVNFVTGLHTFHQRDINPFLIILCPMAMTSDALLAALLASSLENYNRMRQLPANREMLTGLINIAAAGVQEQLSKTSNGAIDDQTLATVIALCELEVIAKKRPTTNSWRIHLDGAKSIISLRGGPQSATTSESRFLLKWLAAFDIKSALTSSPSNAGLLFPGHYWTQANNDNQGFPVDEMNFKLDPYMGFIQDIVPLMLEICTLTRRRENLDELLDLGNASDLHNSSVHLEMALRNSLGRIPGSTWVDPAKINLVLHCHDAINLALIVHLYRRVMGVKSDNPIVVNTVMRGLEEIAGSSDRKDGQVDSSLVFPLFTFGCESTSAHDRHFILERLGALAARGLGHVDRAIDVLLLVWKSN